MGIKALRKVQMGAEATAGTAVPATTIWRGEAGMPEDLSEVVFTPEDVGYLSGTDRAYIPKLQGQVSFPATPATFEQIGYPFMAGIKKVTAAADGTGSGKVYAFAAATTAAPTIQTFTIEGGDDSGAEEIEYAFPQNINLTGAGGQALMLSSTWIGRQVTPTSFTSSLSLPVVEEILFGAGKLYIDDVTGTIGTTAISSALLSMDLSINTGLVPRFTGDNAALYFARHKFTMPEIVLKLTFEHEATAVAEKAKAKAQTPRQIRLVWEGDALTTAGTAYENKSLIIDLAGKWEKFDAIGELDGNDIVTGTFRARFNATANLFALITLVNELATLP